MRVYLSILMFFLITGSTLFSQDIPVKKQVSPINELKKFYFEGKYKEALLAYLHYENDLTPEEAYYLGMTNSALFNYEEALNYLQSAVNKDSLNTGYEYQLAKTNLMVGRTLSAEKCFTHILLREPSYLPALFDAGVLDFSQKKYTDAIRKFKAVTKLTPANFLAFYNLAKSYSNLEPPLRYRDSVSTYLSTAVSINSDYLPAVELLGTWYYNSRNYDQALQLFQKAAAKNPTRSDFIYLTGMCWEKQGKFERAVELYNQAIAMNGNEAHYWDHLGFSNFSQDKFVPAIVAYKQAIKIDEDNPLFYVNLAYAYVKTDSIKQAIESFEAAVVKMHPEEIGKIFSQMGHVYYEKKEYAKAKKEYQTTLIYDPENIDACYLGAVCDAELKNISLALAGYKKVLQLIKEITPENELEKDERYNAVKKLISALSNRTKKEKQ